MASEACCRACGSCCRFSGRLTGRSAGVPVPWASVGPLTTARALLLGQVLVLLDAVATRRPRESCLVPGSCAPEPVTVALACDGRHVSTGTR